jgi:hypothetical protein
MNTHEGDFTSASLERFLFPLHVERLKGFGQEETYINSPPAAIFRCGYLPVDIVAPDVYGSGIVKFRITKCGMLQSEVFIKISTTIY